MSKWKAIEFFAGVGGFAHAVDGRFPIEVAYDINAHAARWYRTQFNHQYRNQSIDGLKVQDILDHGANLWWLSPPCQPFTRKGRQLDWNDNRNLAFRHLLTLLPEVRPTVIAMENVPGFQGSQTHSIFKQVIKAQGYHLSEWCLCPSSLGVPNQRRRYYAVAASAPVSIELNSSGGRSVGEFVNPEHDGDPQLQLPEHVCLKFQKGIHICDSESNTTRCFTAGYGRNWVKSGSYYRHSQGVRTFHPLEVAALLGHPIDKLPQELTFRQAWKCLGNSLSLFVMRRIVDELIRHEADLH